MLSFDRVGQCHLECDLDSLSMIVTTKVLIPPPPLPPPPPPRVQEIVSLKSWLASMSHELVGVVKAPPPNDIP